MDGSMTLRTNERMSIYHGSNGFTVNIEHIPIAARDKPKIIILALEGKGLNDGIIDCLITGLEPYAEVEVCYRSAIANAVMNSASGWTYPQAMIAVDKGLLDPANQATINSVVRYVLEKDGTLIFTAGLVGAAPNWMTKTKARSLFDDELRLRWQFDTVIHRPLVSVYQTVIHGRNGFAFLPFSSDDPPVVQINGVSPHQTVYHGAVSQTPAGQAVVAISEACEGDGLICFVGALARETLHVMMPVVLAMCDFGPRRPPTLGFINAQASLTAPELSKLSFSLVANHTSSMKEFRAQNLPQVVTPTGPRVRAPVCRFTDLQDRQGCAKTSNRTGTVPAALYYMSGASTYRPRYDNEDTASRNIKAEPEVTHSAAPRVSFPAVLKARFSIRARSKLAERRNQRKEHSNHDPHRRPATKRADSHPTVAVKLEPQAEEAPLSAGIPLNSEPHSIKTPGPTALEKLLGAQAGRQSTSALALQDVSPASRCDQPSVAVGPMPCPSSTPSASLNALSTRAPPMFAVPAFQDQAPVAYMMHAPGPVSVPPQVSVVAAQSSYTGNASSMPIWTHPEPASALGRANGSPMSNQKAVFSRFDSMTGRWSYRGSSAESTSCSSDSS